MKKNFTLFKGLLVAFGLLGGVNAWAETETRTVLSEDYESYTTGDIMSNLASSGWTFTGRQTSNPTAVCEQGESSSANTSKYAFLEFGNIGAGRTQYWDFGVGSSLTEDNWTLKFSAKMQPGNNQNPSGLAISGTNTSFTNTATTVTNPIFGLHNEAANGTVYTAVIGGTTLDGTYTLASDTWYKYIIQVSNINEVANTANIYVKIVSYDESITILESTQTGVNTSSIGTLRGLLWNSARYWARLYLDDVLLTQEVDVSVSTPPTFTYKSYSGANRTYTLANPNGGGTLYYTTAPAAEAPAVGDAAYSSTTDLSKDVTYSASGTYYAYVVNASNVASTITSQTVTAVAPSFANGTYYLKNKEAGAYFAGGQAWGTQAITNNIGHSVVLTFSPLELTYTIDTGLSNGGDNHYLTEYLWCDGAATKWSFAEAGEGYYTISYGGNNLTAGASGATLSLTAGTGDNTKWKLLTEAEWKAENVARLDAATANNGVDATFYIPAANFNRNDNTENAKWQGSPTIGGLDGTGIVSNFNAEKFNTTFDVYQVLSGLKPGAYKVSVDGFYRNGTTDDRNAILYANGSETPLVNIRSAGVTVQEESKGFVVQNGEFWVPDFVNGGLNGQANAALTFNNGYYDNELYFVVGNDGALRIGVKKTESVANDWTVFDNFQLTYYGETVPATIGSTGYTTFSSSYPLDLTGIEAYYIASVESDKAMLTKATTATGTVAAGTGLILAGTAGDVISIPVADSGEAINDNLLVGCPTATDVTTPNANAYVLVNNDGAEFQPLSGTYDGGKVTIPAGKAYLNAPGLNPVSGNANLRVVFAGDATGIANIEAAKTENGAMFNMAGQRVNGSYKGIVIKNGKKVLVK